MRLGLVMFSVAALGGGCAEEAPLADPCTGSLAEPPSLEILGAPSEGGREVEAIVEDGDRPLIRGMQAGFHLWINLRVRGMCLEQGVITRELYDATTNALLIAQGERANFTPTTGEPFSGRLAEAIAFFACPDPLGARLDGTSVRIRAKVRDRVGRIAEDEVRFFPRCDEAVQDGVFYRNCLCSCANDTASCGAPDAGTP